MSFSTKLSSFEGPLDLLMHLIEKNKIDIYDIPISEITDQYLDYLDQMEEACADVLSEFLVMAATLLDIKAKMLLPAPADEEEGAEDPREELVRRLLEYKLYKSASLRLSDRERSESRVIYREESLPEEVALFEPGVDLDTYLGDLTLETMREIFSDVLARSSAAAEESTRLTGTVRREEIKVSDRIDYIREHIAGEGSLSFSALIEARRTRMNVIVTFIAVLELMRAGEITAKQSKFGRDIILRLTERAN